VRPKSAGPDRPWRLAQGVVVVRVRLTPKSSAEAIEGIEATAEGPALKARVRAVPEDGKANQAVARLLAGWLGVPKSAVEVVGGQKSRVKSIAVSGDPAAIERMLSERVGTFD
jgi:uncharacterized protein (TIGR00251 family)